MPQGKASEWRSMSVFKQKNAIASAKIKGFEGIDATTSLEKTSSAYDMTNFRILPDGTLEKRCGFAPIAKCSSKVRAIWSGELDKEQHTFILSESTVFSLDSNKSSPANIGYVDTREGDASFIFFDAKLYLMDGSGIYRVSPNAVSSVEGYAPLCGKDWPNATVGEDYEPLNYTTRHIRMTYNVMEPLIYLCVKYVISSIDAVYVNGKLLTDTSSYYFDLELMSVCVLGLNVGDRVELFLTVDSSEIDCSKLFSCKHSVVYGGLTDSRLFLWGGVRNNLMFGSHSIDEESLLESKKVYTNTADLYIPVDAAFTVGREGRRITAVSRHYDRLLIFTDGDTWMSSSPAGDGEPLEAITINSSHGCTSDGAAIMCGNDPICVGDGEILRWSTDTDELNECNAKCISQKINSRLDRSFFDNAIMFLNKPTSELFFSDPNDESDTVWVYNLDTDNWYRFSGIRADYFFSSNGKMGFVSYDTVYLFDDSLYKDTYSDGKESEIVAEFVTHPTDLFINGNKKRLYGMLLEADLDGGEVNVKCMSDGKAISEISFESEKHFPISIQKRINSHRFCYTSLRISAGGDARQKIYGTAIWAKA